MTDEDWFKLFEENKNGYREKLLKSIGRSGTPLEIKTIENLKRLGYKARSGYYTDQTRDGHTITRQIDILGHKISDIDCGKIKISLTTLLVGDCKYSNERNLMVFLENDDDKSEISMKFPVIINGAHFILQMNNKTLLNEHFTEFFKITNISRKIMDFQVITPEKIKTYFGKDIENYIHGGCEQVTSALNFLYNKERSWIDFSYGRLKSQYFTHEINKMIDNGKTPNDIISNLSDNFDFDRNELYISLYFLIPIIVLDNKFKLINVKLKSDFSVESLDKLDDVVYLHAPTDFVKYEKLLFERYELPISIVNVDALDNYMKKVDAGIEILKQKIRDYVTRQPNRVVEDILSWHFKEYPYNSK